MPARLPLDGHSLAIGQMYTATKRVLPATGWLYIATGWEVDRDKLVGQWLRHWAPNPQVVSSIPTATLIYSLLFYFLCLKIHNTTVTVRLANFRSASIWLRLASIREDQLQ